MPTLTARQIAEATGGRVLAGDPDAAFTDYCFDSRLIRPGGLFFALVTDAADGHAYVAQVAATEGTGAVVAHDFDRSGLDLPLIAVADTRAAYRDLAVWVRQRFTAPRYVAVTGSVGKTTTREFTHQILGHRFHSYSAPGNWNNWQGVPFALFKMPDAVEVAVFELAMSDPGIGEIDHLAAILRPHITCVLNAFPVHLEYLGTVDNVALAKLEINNYLGEGDVALVNGDSPHLRRHLHPGSGRVLWFGRDPEVNDACLTAVRHLRDRVELELSVDGEAHHLTAPPLTAAQIENLFAAALLASRAGMTWDSIGEAVAALRPVSGRGTIHHLGGVTLVDDTYNSNPIAARTLLRWARDAHPGRPLAAILGDMLELGADGPRYHEELGQAAAELGLEALVTVGPLSEHTASGAISGGLDPRRVVHVAHAEDAAAPVLPHLEPGWVVVVKGSRGIRLERTVTALRTALEPADVS